jgi:hypothetical protein
MKEECFYCRNTCHLHRRLLLSGSNLLPSAEFLSGVQLPHGEHVSEAHMNHGDYLKGKECGPRKLQKEAEAVPKRDISVQAGKILRPKRTEDFKSFHFLLIFFFSLKVKPHCTTTSLIRPRTLYSSRRWSVGCGTIS